MDIYIAKIAFIGAAIATLGDGLSALAAGMALQQLQNPTNQSNGIPFEQSKQVESLQQQIDQLIVELKHVKRMIR